MQPDRGSYNNNCGNCSTTAREKPQINFAAIQNTESEKAAAGSRIGRVGNPGVWGREVGDWIQGTAGGKRRTQKARPQNLGGCVLGAWPDSTDKDSVLHFILIKTFNWIFNCCAGFDGAMPSQHLLLAIVIVVIIVIIITMLCSIGHGCSCCFRGCAKSASVWLNNYTRWCWVRG